MNSCPPGTGGDDWLIQDADNGPASPGVLQDGGTFWLTADDNAVTLSHDCPLYRDRPCDAWHEDSVESQTCDSSNVNWVHRVAAGICVLEDSSD
jgi:hypothetical protein